MTSERGPAEASDLRATHKKGMSSVETSRLTGRGRKRTRRRLRSLKSKSKMFSGRRMSSVQIDWSLVGSSLALLFMLGLTSDKTGASLALSHEYEAGDQIQRPTLAPGDSRSDQHGEQRRAERPRSVYSVERLLALLDLRQDGQVDEMVPRGGEEEEEDDQPPSQLKPTTRRAGPVRGSRHKRARNLNEMTATSLRRRHRAATDEFAYTLGDQQKTARLKREQTLHWRATSTGRRQQQQREWGQHRDLLEQPPNELLFSNQTGALVQCGVAFELAQGIARADRQRRRLAQARTQGGAVDSQAANNQQQPAIQIRWEKENGDEIETQLYASESSADSYSPGPAERPLERPLEQPLEQQRVNPNRPLLRYVRPSDGALVFEPFKPLDFRPEVHATSYRCVASVLIEPQQQQQPPHVFLQTSPPVVGLHSTNTNNNQNPVPASVVSRDMRVRAVVGPTTQQTSIKIEVLDELAIEGNSVTFRCQVPAYASAYLQLLDWRESPTESTFAVHQGSLALLFAAPSASFKHSSSVHLARRQNLNQTSSSSSLIQLASLQQQRYFVNPKTYELTILNVDASLHQRAYRCRCKNKLTGELLQSQNEGRLYLSESRAPFAPKLASYQLKSMASISGQQEAAFQDQQEHANKANLLNANLLVYEEGETALLVCHHQAYPRARIGWFKRDLVSLTDGLHETPLQAVQLDQDLALPALANEISNQTLMSASANTHQVLSKYIQLSNLLLVSRLSRNDSGVYVCRASNLMGQDRFSMSIEVRAPLKAKLSASSNVLELGKSLALECTISGWPVHQVVFKHNQQVIKTISGSDAQALLQQSPSTTQMRSDQDQGGQSSSDANYFVLDDLDPDEQNDDETGQDEREDDKKSPLPAATQQEQLNGGPPVRANSKLLSHVMVIVLEPHHAGAYQCFAHNQFESVQAASFVRVLDDPPKFRETFKSDLYQPNQEISLHCAARANPLPEITWTIDEMPLLDVEASTSLRIRFGDFVTRDNLVVSYVNISQARVSDSGLYRCTADNRLARVSHEAQISIWGEPQVKAMPNVTVLAGGGFRQRCPVAGWPLGDVQWLHNGHRLPTNHRQHVHENGTLEVEHMERSAGDEGEYTCQVLGGGGGGSPGSTSSSSSSSKDSPASAGQKSSAAQGSVWVSIRAKPTIEPFAISRQLREGQRASIMCTISSGDLPIGISWFRNGDLLVPLSPAGPDWSQSSSGLTPSANNNNHQAVAMVPINRNPHQHQHHHTASQLLPDEPLAGPPPPSPSSTTTTTTAMNPSGQLNSNIQQQPGPSLAGVRISRVSDYSSTLLFESLLSIHTGNYTCLARNDAGQSSHQAPMVVQVAPKWSIEPGDKTIVRGSSSSIDCMASGFPPPRVIWTKASGDQQASQLGTATGQSQANQPADRAGHLVTSSSHHLGSWRSIVSSPHLQVYENGSLNVLDARDSDFGHYMCQASNGVGPGLSKVIRVTINVAAQFQTRHSIQYAARGELAHLKCQAKGDWPLHLSWFKSRHRLEPINFQDNQSSLVTSAAGASQSSLLLTSSTASVMSVFEAAGPSSSSFLNGATAQELFAASSSSNGTIASAMRLAGGESVAEQLGSWLPATLTSNNHAPGQAGSRDGPGLLLERYSLATSEYFVSSPLASSQSSPTVTQLIRELKQEQQQNLMGGPSLLHRQLVLQQEHQSRLRPPVVVQLNSVLSIQRPERQDTGAYRCLAYNQFGHDERIIQLVVQEPPERVEELSILEVSSRSVTLGWLMPYDGNAPITNYLIQYRPSQFRAPPGQTMQLSGGELAVSSIADSSANFQQQETTNFRWFNHTIAAASLTSTANVNGPEPRQAAPNKAQQAAPTKTLSKVTIPALKPVTHYWFRLEAENKLGRGPVSSIIETMTLEEAPGAAPGNLRAKAKSSSSVLVSWSKLNEREVFGSVHGYYVAYRPLPGQEELTSASQQQHKNSSDDAPKTTTNIYKTIQHDDKLHKFDALLTGLKRSTKYMISVQAFNGRGTGPSSEALVVKTLEMDPPRPLKLFVKQSTNCSIQLEWRPLSQAALLSLADSGQSTVGSSGMSGSLQAQDSSQGDLVDFYSLFQAEMNAEQPARPQEVRLPGHAASYQAEGLTCGTRYQFFMMGTNKIGQGEQSEILDTKTAGGLPVAPDRQSTFDVINTTCYVVRLDHWQDNNCPIQRFDVRYRLEPSRDWQQLAHFDLQPGSKVVAQLPPNQMDPKLVQAQPQSAISSTETTTKTTSTSLRTRVRRAVEDSDNLIQDDQQDFALVDYPAAAAALMEGDESNLQALDYMALEAASLISKDDNTEVESSFMAGDEPLQQPANSNQFYGYLKESQMPTFSVRELAAHTDLPLNSESPVEAAAKSKAMPQEAQRWQASNFVIDSQAGGSGKGDRQATPSTSDGQRANPSNGLGVSDGTSWRRVRLCNLVENAYYTVQIRVLNRVGETEAELQLLTSPEGLEYDHNIKRHVVVKQVGGGASSSAGSSDRMLAHSSTNLNDRLGLLAFSSQWPVLMPITLLMTLITIIIIIALLLKRSVSPGRSAGGGASPSSSTTSTANTTMQSQHANGGGGGCPNGYLDDPPPPPGNHHGTLNGPSSTLYHSHNHHHHASTLQHYSRGPPTIADTTDGSELMVGAAAVDNYASVVAGPARHSSTLFAHNQFDCRPQFDNNSGTMMPTSANEIHLANIYQQRANNQQQALYGAALAQMAPPSQVHAATNEEAPYGLAGMISGLQMQNSTQAPSCSSDPTQTTLTTTNQSSSSSSTTAPLSSVNSTSTGGDHYPPHHHHATANTLPLHFHHHQAQNQMDPLKGMNVYLCTSSSKDQEQQEAKQQQQEAAIFYGLPHMSQQASNFYNSQPQHQIQMRRFQPADENSNNNQDSLHQVFMAQQQQQINNSNNDCDQQRQSLDDRVVFDPVYATIRRTFPQAFKYLTLQHKSSQQLSRNQNMSDNNRSQNSNNNNDQHEDFFDSTATQD